MVIFFVYLCQYFFYFHRNSLQEGVVFACDAVYSARRNYAAGHFLVRTARHQAMNESNSQARHVCLTNKGRYGEYRYAFF